MKFADKLNLKGQRELVTLYTLCIKIIQFQIWRVITQNIFGKFGWFVYHCKVYLFAFQMTFCTFSMRDLVGK